MWKPYQFYSKTYFINQFGEVKNSNGLIMKSFYNSDGYLRIQLCDSSHREERKIHRMVAEVFCDPPDNFNELEVDHINNIRNNNYYKNLRWVTRKENIQHIVDCGNHVHEEWSGYNNSQSKLNIDDIKFIRDLYDNKNLKMCEIWHQYYEDKCSQNTIEHICKRKTWKHI